MNKLTSVFVAALATTTVATASQVSNTGFYLGASAGGANTSVKYDWQNDDPQPGTHPASAYQRKTKADAGKFGGLFGLFAGHGISFGQGAYVGGEVYGGLDTAKVAPVDDSQSGAAVGLFKTDVKRTNFYGISARIGYLVTPSTMVYGRLGIEGGKWTAKITPNAKNIDAHLASEISTIAAGAQPSAFTQEQQQQIATATAIATETKANTSRSKNSIGFAPGVGMETSLNKNVFLRAEYTFLFGPKITLKQNISGYSESDIDGTKATHHLKITQQAFKIGLGYRF